MNLTNSNKSGLRVLSYNVRVFNSYKHLRKPGVSPEDLIKWTLQHDADIKSLQEFYHYPKDDSFDVLSRFRKNTPYYFFEPASIIRKQYFGQAIFSKYPIIDKGKVEFKNSGFNQAIFADIMINEDTIRVYNIHLQSMSIKDENLSTKYSPGTWDNFKDVFVRVKKGAVLRSKQTEALIKHIKMCPYQKVLVTGDLNDTPYSYTYQMLSEELDNAFEEKGEEFGFTYNGKLFFIRIDNIFSSNMKVNTFETRKDVKYTDHFPIEASFRF